MLNGAGESVFLHLDDLLDVIHGAEKSVQLSLLQNEVNSLNTHRVEEPNRGVAHVHVSDVGRGPLPTILSPNTDELPLTAITLGLDRKSQLLHTFGQVLTDGVDLLVGLPLVVAKLGDLLPVNLFISEPLSCAEISVVRPLLNMSLKVVQESFALRVDLQVVVVLDINSSRDEFL